MPLSKKDLQFFQKHYPEVEFNDAYWAFSVYGGKDAAVMCPGLEAEVSYGLVFKGGGCIAELGMEWNPSGSNLEAPYLKAFMDAAVLLACPTHQKLSMALMKYKESGPTPEQFSKLLRSFGFEDETKRLPAEQGAHDEA